jgi:hypothetical protein
MKFFNVLIVLALVCAAQCAPIYNEEIRNNRVIRSGENAEGSGDELVDLEPRPIPL